MKVLYLINQYPKLSHSFIRREIHALENQGVSVVRVSIRLPPSSPDPKDQSEAKITKVLLSDKSGLLTSVLLNLLTHPVRFVKTFFKAMRLSKAADRGRLAHFAYFIEANLLARIVAAENVSHIHAHFGTNPPAVAILTRSLCDVTYSFTVHGPEEFDRPYALKLREKIEDAAFVAAVSSFGRSQLMRWCSQRHWSKIKVVRCGLDQQFLGMNESKPYEEGTLVCVGRLCEQKGQLLLVDAMAVLNERGIDAKLILAGDGEMRHEIEARIGELGLNDRVHITGWLTGDEVKQHLVKAKAMVLPSFAEGLPVVIMESFALGRPVITTYIAGIPELVQDGFNGWLIPAGSVNALADAMANVVDATPDQIRSMADHAESSVARFHNIDDIAAELKAHILACASKETRIASVADVSTVPRRIVAAILDTSSR